MACRTIIEVFAPHIPSFGFVRFYGRWMHRKPVKAILPFEPNSKVSLKKEKVIDLSSNGITQSETTQSNKNNEEKNAKNIVKDMTKSSSDKFKEIKENRETIMKKRKFYLSQKKVFDDNNEVIYEKLKDNDGRISSLLVKLKSKKDRIRVNQVLVEGWRLIVDGLEAKCCLNYILFSRTEDLDNLRPFLPKTGVQIYKIPYKEMELWSGVETCPGILGVFEMPTPENIRRLSKPLPLQFICDNIRVPGNLGAILRAAVGVGCEKVLLSKGCVDMWDSKVIRSAAGAHFRLPIHHSIEWDEMFNHLPPETSLFIADSSANRVDMTNYNESEIADSQIPVVPYYSVDFAPLKHISLIIGGETEGISEMSYRLAATKNGLRLNIPLQKGVDSLNTGMAAAVISFEIKKQIVLALTKAKLEMQAMS